MIRMMKNLLMKLISPSIPETDVNRGKNAAGAGVRRRVEVTVERESVSVRVTDQPGDRPEGKGSEKDVPEAPSSQSQLAPSTDSPAVEPRSERGARTPGQKSREG